MKRIQLIKIVLVSHLLLASSCPKENKKKTSEEKSKAKEIITTIEKNNLPYFKAQGTEPFWGLTLSEKEFVFTTPEDTIVLPAVAPIVAADHNVKLFRSQNDAHSFAIEIIQMECTNAMSGKKFPYRVTLSIDQKQTTWIGCGAYITDYRLHDIWVLEQLNGKKVDATDFSKEFPQLEIKAQENTFSGFAGCNQMQGRLFFEPKKIRFINVVTTEMACEPTNKETEFLKALSSTTTYTIENNRLYLSNPNKKLLILKKID
ncbi:META domain-containing protein [Flavobacterium sp. J27]|uniref:META domain-containing protein n=1 Tax=Flavobacterium sp. J27 TaxID=2060419 RepID=UPI0010307C8D|nr:META domain-containing protein [Flavobacterium sp. J27]